MTEEEKRLRELLTKESVDAFRIIVIEECARVCEPYYELEPRQSIVAAKIAATIRALKDKP